MIIHIYMFTASARRIKGILHFNWLCIVGLHWIESLSCIKGLHSVLDLQGDPTKFAYIQTANHKG